MALAIVVATALASAQGRAQPAAGAVAAEALFNEGRELLARGSFAEACRKLEASQKIDPAVGTLFSMGECYEGQARLASAWFAYRAAAALAGSREDHRRVAAQKKADALEPSLAHLVLRVPPGSTPGEITLDGDHIVPDAVRQPHPRGPRPAPRRGARRHRVDAGRSTCRPTAPRVPVEIPPAADLAAPTETLHVPVARRALGVGLAAGGAADASRRRVGPRDAGHRQGPRRTRTTACTTGLACGDAPTGGAGEGGVAKTDADASTVLFPVGLLIGAAGTYLLATSRATLEPVVSPLGGEARAPHRLVAHPRDRRGMMRARRIVRGRSGVRVWRAVAWTLVVLLARRRAARSRICVTSSTSPVSSACSPPTLPTAGSARVRLVNAGTTGRSDFCVRPSGSTDWGQPVLHDPNASCPSGLDYAQATIPFAMPAGAVDVEAIPRRRDV